MPKELPYYKMYPADFETDARCILMTLEEIGAYVRLLNYAWINNGLPDSHVDLPLILHITPSKFQSLWKRIGPCFTSVDGKLINERQEREREDAIRKSNKATQSVRTRYERSQVVGVSYGDTRYESVSESSLSISQKKENQNDAVAAFDAFRELWQAPCEECGYVDGKPRTTFEWRDPDLAARQWLSLDLSVQAVQFAMDGLRHARASEQWHKGMVPSAARWLGFSNGGKIEGPKWAERLKAYEHSKY